MDNYYEHCLSTINQLIKEDKTTEAMSILRTELAMPYVPEPYFTTFSNLLDSIAVPMSTTIRLEDIDEIVKMLSTPSEAQIHALVSLQNMNLHKYKDELRYILETHEIDETIKKHVLMCAKEQNVDLTVTLILNGESLTLNTSDIIDPYERDEYQNVYRALCEYYESNNPSMLELSIEVLNGLTFEAFPFWDASIQKDEVIRRIEAYFNYSE